MSDMSDMELLFRLGEMFNVVPLPKETHMLVVEVENGGNVIINRKISVRDDQDPDAEVLAKAEMLISENDFITLEAIPNEGYEFVCWSSGEEIISYEDMIGFELEGTSNIMANFRKH